MDDILDSSLDARQIEPSAQPSSAQIISNDTCILQQDEYSPEQPSGDHCVICLDTISERAVTVPCNHYAFDFICIASWVQEQDRCPLCKAQIVAIEYDWRNATDFRTYKVRPRVSTTRNEGALSSTRPVPSQRRSRHRERLEAEPEDPAVLRRRHVYKHALYSLHIGDNHISGFLSFTPRDFAISPALQRKARIWIRRELQVFQFLDNSSSQPTVPDRPVARGFVNAEFLLEYMIAMLRNVDIRGADGRAEGLLTEMLGRSYARLFLHELDSWMRSPLTRIKDWDNLVQYESAPSQAGPMKR